MSGGVGEYKVQADDGMGSVSSVVSSLPVGYTLGDARVDNGVKYRLCYNAGGTEIDQSYMCSAVGVTNSGGYSMTVSTASQGGNHVNAAMCVHATVAAGSYFWGATYGPVGLAVGDSASIPTGSLFAIGDNGSIQLMPQSVVTGKEAVGYVITTVSNGGTGSGNVFLNLPG